MPEGFDPQTIWMVAILLMAFAAMKYVIPRLVAGTPFLEPQIIQQRMTAGEDLVILDVRTPEEFAGPLGRAPGSVNVPLGELSSRLAAGAGDLDEIKGLPVEGA